MEVCPHCYMGPRGIEQENGQATRYECQNCGCVRYECVGMYCTELLPAFGSCSKECDPLEAER